MSVHLSELLLLSHRSLKGINLPDIASTSSILSVHAILMIHSFALRIKGKARMWQVLIIIAWCESPLLHLYKRFCSLYFLSLGYLPHTAILDRICGDEITIFDYCTCTRLFSSWTEWELQNSDNLRTRKWVWTNQLTPNRSLLFNWSNKRGSEDYIRLEDQADFQNFLLTASVQHEI